MRSSIFTRSASYEGVLTYLLCTFNTYLLSRFFTCFSCTNRVGMLHRLNLESAEDTLQLAGGLSLIKNRTFIGA